jgi:hypothetical protein
MDARDLLRIPRTRSANLHPRPRLTNKPRNPPEQVLGWWVEPG